jgi:nitroreductase
MDTVRSVLHIPDQFTPVGIIPVGYPLPDVPSPSLKRGAVKPEDFVRWNGW